MSISALYWSQTLHEKSCGIRVCVSNPEEREERRDVNEHAFQLCCICSLFCFVRGGDMEGAEKAPGTTALSWRGTAGRPHLVEAGPPGCPRANGPNHRPHTSRKSRAHGSHRARTGTQTDVKIRSGTRKRACCREPSRLAAWAWPWGVVTSVWPSTCARACARERCETCSGAAVPHSLRALVPEPVQRCRS